MNKKFKLTLLICKTVRDRSRQNAYKKCSNKKNRRIFRHFVSNRFKLKVGKFQHHNSNISEVIR